MFQFMCVLPSATQDVGYVARQLWFLLATTAHGNTQHKYIHSVKAGALIMWILNYSFCSVQGVVPFRLLMQNVTYKFIK